MDIKKKFRDGWLPAPGETEQQFELRMETSLTFAAKLNDGEEIEGLPFSFDKKYDSEEARDRVFALYGFRPTWMPVFLSKKKLPFWQGGALWILTLDNPPVEVAVIQLRGNNTEWAVHELCHVPRLAFPESSFEEFFTYRSSESWWRKYLGPLFTNGQEASLYLFCSLVVVSLSLYFQFEVGLLFPFAILSFLGLRLLKRHMTLQRCIRHLESLSIFPWRIAYGLTDSEIRRFAGSSPVEIQDYVDNQKELRWQFLRQWLSPHS